MLNKIEFRKVREFGEVINDTFLFLKQNFKPLMKAFVYLCGFFIVAGVIATVMNQVAMMNVVAKNTDYGFGYGERFNALFTLNYLFAIIFAILNYTAITVTVLSYIALYVEKGNVAPGVDEVWAYFKYYFFRALVSTVLVGVFIVICFICCIIPGIYVFPAMSLFFPVMMFENASAGYCFSRSFKLLKEQWWITAATLFIVWLITYACTLFVSLPAIILGVASAFTQGAKSVNTVTVVVTGVLQYLCQILYLLPLIGASFCYFNLRERQESTGLMERIAALGKPAGDLDTAPEDY